MGWGEESDSNNMNTMNPTATAQRLAEETVHNIKYAAHPDLAADYLKAYADAAIQEATKELHTEKDDWQLRCRNAIDHWHREAELLVAERDQLRADLAAAYEREKVLNAKETKL